MAGSSKLTQKYTFHMIGSIKENLAYSKKESHWGSIFRGKVEELLKLVPTGEYIQLKVYPKKGAKGEFLLQALIPREDYDG